MLEVKRVPLQTGFNPAAYRYYESKWVGREERDGEREEGEGGGGKERSVNLTRKFLFI